MKRYGIFGGTFNPPHIAHAIVAQSVMEQLELDKIIFIPSGNPPLKNSIPAFHRFEMSRLAFGNNPGFEVSDIEIKDAERSFTVNTLTKLNDIYKNDDVEINLILGIDNLIQLPQWKDPKKLFDLSKVVVINRPDYDVKNSKPEFADRVTFVQVPFLEVSSSGIRERVLNGKSIRYLVTYEVEKYIHTNHLYEQK